MASRLTVLVEPDAAAAAATTAHIIAKQLTSIVRTRGQATIAFSGGSTPALMFDTVATLKIPWERVDVFQVDERVTSDDDPARNWGDLQRRLLDPVGLPEHRRHPMDVTHTDLLAAARSYSKELRLRAPDGLDLIHLGLGDDGHTASWPPGDPVIRSTKDVTIVGPYRELQRMTVTPRVVNRARQRVWLVVGQEKRAALAALLQQDPTIPASASRVAEIDMIIADSAAATAE